MSLFFEIDEILVSIFLNLDCDSLTYCSEVCKTWLRVIREITPLLCERDNFPTSTKFYQWALMNSCKSQTRYIHLFGERSGSVLKQTLRVNIDSSPIVGVVDQPKDYNDGCSSIVDKIIELIKAFKIGFDELLASYPREISLEQLREFRDVFNSLSLHKRFHRNYTAELLLKAAMRTCN